MLSWLDNNNKESLQPFILPAINFSTLLSVFYVNLLLMQQARAHLLDVEPFEHAFGPKGKRKRPKLTALDYESLLKKADDSQGESCLLMI